MPRLSAPVLCLSHLRWQFVTQRPQHLLSRCARERRVVYFEEPIFGAARPELVTVPIVNGPIVATPHLPHGMPAHCIEATQKEMIDQVVEGVLEGQRPVLWYYTPMALPFTQHVRARATVYDCMDELSLFHGAPPELVEREGQLLRAADVVFTGGHTLYRHKKQTSGHRNIHAFPSSVDVSHFGRAREALADPSDQAGIARPRVGFFGVIDERLDVALLDQLAELRPDLQLVMIGPVVKIDPATLPRRDNIHWLGGKSYAELPDYIAGWDVAMLPFARNESTRFISPTKTPEYLAAGKPVVSTSITDVVTPYGRDGLAAIADTASEMSIAIDEAIASDGPARRAHADSFLADLSWNHTWQSMWELVERDVDARAMRSSGLQAVARSGAGASGSDAASAVHRAPVQD